MRILLTRKLHDFAIKDLQKRYEVIIHRGKTPMPRKTLIEKIRNVDGLICFPYDIIDKEILESAEKLRVISTYSVGYDHIDLNSARKKSIKIGYTPEVLTNATADLTVGLMLDLMRRITEGDRLIRAGKWSQIFGAHDYVGVDLEGKTLGMLGMGRIGQAVVKRARGFGMTTKYHIRTRLSKIHEKRLGIEFVSFSELIKTSDVLSLHVPHTKQTHHIINLNSLQKMKKTAILINTARGKIINEKDLIRALKTKTIAGAALDVFEKEPIGKNHPMTKMQNVVLAPHIGSSSAETRAKMAQITVQNLVLGLQGKKMIHSVL
ncbi:MAG: D-glycerate dehydrogenase [Nitrosopumilaceae archaeon]|nr:D-glycerate dehydrogenase [Nitrosopumilaceae archaeon]NDB87731.1 D-glycerate dehydrogenase [Nitrososphaerota archaeon]NDF26145.1 D-glycerate dehydrogenase [Nitrosopumilaceae archaeon]NDF46631.1 D-glycerate dehydrogenase [Nitrosopumilaceae archaeon]